MSSLVLRSVCQKLVQPIRGVGQRVYMSSKSDGPIPPFWKMTQESAEFRGMIGMVIGSGIGLYLSAKEIIINNNTMRGKYYSGKIYKNYSFADATLQTTLYTIGGAVVGGMSLSLWFIAIPLMLPGGVDMGINYYIEYKKKQQLYKFQDPNPVNVEEQKQKNAHITK